MLKTVASSPQTKVLSGLALLDLSLAFAGLFGDWRRVGGSFVFPEHNRVSASRRATALAERCCQYLVSTISLSYVVLFGFEEGSYTHLAHIPRIQDLRRNKSFYSEVSAADTSKTQYIRVALPQSRVRSSREHDHPVKVDTLRNLCSQGHLRERAKSCTITRTSVLV